ncbi:DNA helicase, partial [Pseudomonas aeruginosa]
APDTDPGKRDDELNLIYVAVTRAMKILAINSLVLSIMQRYVDDRKLKEQIASCKK